MQRAATESRSNALRNCSMAPPEDLRPQSGRVWNWRPGVAPLAATQLAAMPLAGMDVRRLRRGRRFEAAVCFLEVEFRLGLQFGQEKGLHAAVCPRLDRAGSAAFVGVSRKGTLTARLFGLHGRRDCFGNLIGWTFVA